MERIIQTACEVFKMRADYLFNDEQLHVKSKPRMAIAYCLKQQGYSLTQIGLKLKKYKQYGSFYYYKAVKLINNDQDFKNKVIQIMDRSLK